MSGVELIAVLGVVANAAHLIEFSLKMVDAISEIYGRSKEASKRIVRYTAQINQIIAAGRAIEEYEDLQTPLINSQLQNTLTEVKHSLQILRVIQQDYTTGSSSKRMWRAIVGNKEKLMLACFERLEKEKTALILCITVVHTQALQKIGAGVEILINKDITTRKDKKRQLGVISTLKKSNGKDPAPVPNHSETAVGIIPSNNSLVSRDTNRSGDAQLNSKKALKERQTFEKITASKKAIQYNGNINENKNSSHIYNGIKARSGSFQHNGNRGSAGNHKHTNIDATEGAVQINGNIMNRMTDQEIKKLTQSQYTRQRGF